MFQRIKQIVGLDHTIGAIVAADAVDDAPDKESVRLKITNLFDQTQEANFLRRLGGDNREMRTNQQRQFAQVVFHRDACRQQ